MSYFEQMQSRELFKYLSIFFILAAFTALFFVANYQHATLVEVQNGTLKFTDLSHYFWAIQDLWFGQGSKVYDLNTHLRILSLVAGFPVSQAMPLGITPTAFLLLFPFACVAEFNLALSHALWAGFSFTLLFVSLSKFATTVGGIRSRRGMRLVLVNLLLLMSYSAVVVIALGQTSIMALAALLLLIHTCYSEEKAATTSIQSSLKIAILMFCLSIKFPYVMIGGVILLIFKQWRALLLSGAAIALVLAFLTPKFGYTWPLEYYAEVVQFSNPQIPAVYERAIAVDLMNIFRSAFRDFIGDNVAIKLSSLIFFATILLISISVLPTKIVAQLSSPFRLNKINQAQKVIMITGSYLLFAPYCGAYEEILVLLALNLTFLTNPSRLLQNYRLLLLVPGIWLLLNRQVILPSAPIWIFWTLKLGIFVSLLLMAQIHRRTESATSSD